LDVQRIHGLIDSAAKARETGRIEDAHRLLHEAERGAPGHPRVLNEMGRQRLSAGDAWGAYEVLAQAVKAEPSNPSIWLNLAAALRRLNRREEEMAAIQRVLAIEPRNLLAHLQKASLLELQNKPRAAAAAYRTALQSLPPGTRTPDWMAPVLAHARQAVDANNRALEVFLEERLTTLRGRYADQPLRRFDRCLATLVQKERIYRQQPSFMYFPYLPAIEFYERSDFPWLAALEAATDDIREELLCVLSDGDDVLEPYVAHGRTGSQEARFRDLHQSRRWGVYFLWQEGVAYPEHIARCPRTVAALENWPRCEVPGCSPTVVFSILDAKARIPPHTGVNNTRLIIHLPLIVPPGCGFRVGAEHREWEPGQALIFDDTIEHEAWNDSDEPRAVLILDVWNPALSVAEREMVRAAVAGVNDFYGFSTMQQVV
jgi:aspartyl/asparaginyl beta-hydroxylase (cupin superfamily)